MLPSGKIKNLFERFGRPSSGALIVCNHVAAHGDWAPICSLVARQGPCALGGVRFVVKDIAKWIPGFGWAMWLMNWPFLKRKWASDKNYLERKLRSHNNAGTGAPLSMAIFPEGTCWTVKQHARAVSFAKERQLYLPTHTLCPRYKGFKALVRGLSASGCADTIWDVTLAYTGFNMKPGMKGPGPLQVLLHDAREGAPEVAFHIHVRRLDLTEVNAMDDVTLKKALFDWFERKDGMIEEFLSGTKRFPGDVRLDSLPASQWIPSVLVTSALAGVFVWSVWVMKKALWVLLFHSSGHEQFLDMFYSFRRY